MGRKPFGIENVLEALKQLAGADSEIIHPVQELRAKIKLSEITVRRYLKKLAENHSVILRYGGHKGVQLIGCTLCPPSSLTEPTTVPPPIVVESAPDAPEPTDARATEPPIGGVGFAEAPPTKQSLPNLVLLVDYDNAWCRARDHGYTLSFSRLKEHVRGMGHILFADAFLSPHSTNNGLIRRLWHAGFQVIACPMATKDKDAVDQKILWRARSYIESEAIGLVVIVSADHDFDELAEFALDRHKDLRFIDAAHERARLEGTNSVQEGPPELSPSANLSKFMQAVDALRTGNRGATGRARGQIDFVKEIIAQLDFREKTEHGRRAPFNYLKEFVWDHVRTSWGQMFSLEDLRAALTAIVQSGILVTQTGNGFTYYTLKQDHPIMVPSIKAAAPAAAAT